MPWDRTRSVTSRRCPWSFNCNDRGNIFMLVWSFILVSCGWKTSARKTCSGWTYASWTEGGLTSSAITICQRIVVVGMTTEDLHGAEGCWMPVHRSPKESCMEHLCCRKSWTPLVASQCQRTDGPTCHRASSGCNIHVVQQQPTRWYLARSRSNFGLST